MKTQRRRRKESRTDYRARLGMLKSNKPRLVIRKSNQYIIAQVVETNIAQDKVIVGLTSKVLLSKGWSESGKGSLKSLAASYLTGYILGNLAKTKVKEVIVDFGLNRNIHKSRLYAVVKGAIDGGLKVLADNEALPSLEQIKSNKKFG